MSQPDRNYHIFKESIGQILLKRNLITADHLKKALDVQKIDGGMIGAILVRLGHVEEMDIVVALIIQFHLPYIAINKYSIEKNVLDVVPVEIARKYHIVPLGIVGNVLSLVMADPLDNAVVEEVEKKSFCKIARFIATKTEIDEAINKNYTFV